MATSSIFQEVNLKDRVRIRKLIRAMERSEASRAEDVTLKRNVSEMTKEQIQKVFGDGDDRL